MSNLNVGDPIADTERSVLVYRKALQLVCEELGALLPNKPAAKNAQAWVNYAAAILDNRPTE